MTPGEAPRTSEALERCLAIITAHHPTGQEWCCHICVRAAVAAALAEGRLGRASGGDPREVIEAARVAVRESVSGHGGKMVLVPATSWGQLFRALEALPKPAPPAPPGAPTRIDWGACEHGLRAIECPEHHPAGASVERAGSPEDVIDAAIVWARHVNTWSGWYEANASQHERNLYDAVIALTQRRMADPSAPSAPPPAGNAP